MKLYHGTNIYFEKIELSKSKPNKDFGRGFYLTDKRQQAEELATARTILAGGEPLVLSYDFDEVFLEGIDLKVLKFNDYSEEWARFILKNRNNEGQTPVHDYDIVYGPIANDRVGAQLWKYKNHSIDMAMLVQNLKYMKGITFQYYFGTQRAIDKLRLI